MIKEQTYELNSEENTISNEYDTKKSKNKA